MKSSLKISKAEVTILSSQRLEKCFVPDEMFLLFDFTGDGHVEGNSQVFLINICLFYFNVCTVHIIQFIIQANKCTIYI